MPNSLDKILIASGQNGFEKKLTALRQKVSQAAVFAPTSAEGLKVAEIIEDVRKGGDKAVSKYTKLFDGINLKPAQFKISQAEIKKAHKQIAPKLLVSIRKSIANVKKYQKQIFAGKNKLFKSGCGIRYTPVKRACMCVPGASAPLPSTVIMTAVPALVAGVKEIVITSPPRYNGSIHPVILAVCLELGITEIYRIGGVQAVAAMAYGTKTIKPVDMLVGPGNKWVATAKKNVYGQVKIDSIAGPSEVLIIADANANAELLAADMISQAEHAPAGAVLFTTSKLLAKKVIVQLDSQLNSLDRKKETLNCLKKFSGIAVFKNINDCVKWANAFATEHLEIHCGKNSRKIAEKIENAGAIFIGENTPVAVGDYFAGPSHTLPTGGCAKFSSALSSNDFLKSSSIIEYNAKTLKTAAEDIINLANAEGLSGHAESIKKRLKNGKSKCV